MWQWVPIGMPYPSQLSSPLSPTLRLTNLFLTGYITVFARIDHWTWTRLSCAPCKRLHSALSRRSRKLGACITTMNGWPRERCGPHRWMLLVRHLVETDFHAVNTLCPAGVRRGALGVCLHGGPELLVSQPAGAVEAVLGRIKQRL